MVEVLEDGHVRVDALYGANRRTSRVMSVQMRVQPDAPWVFFKHTLFTLIANAKLAVCGFGNIADSHSIMFTAIAQSCVAGIVGVDDASVLSN